MKPILFNTDMVRAILKGRKTVTRKAVKPQPLWRKPPIQQKSSPDYWANWDDERIYKSPYSPGGILYVREVWTQDGDVFRYKAGFYDQNRKWRPSIHMPKEAARIFLRVTDVRVERLWDITNTGLIDDFGYHTEEIVTEGWEALGRKMWNSTIKPADCALYGWKANPWVWVINRTQKPKRAF